MKITAKILGFGTLAVAALFSVYYYNLDMKLIRYVIAPVLDKHYDSMQREHVI